MAAAMASADELEPEAEDGAHEFVAESHDAQDEDELAAALREAAAFRANPLDVNTAPLAALLRVPGLDPAAAARVVAHRDRRGPFATLETMVGRGTLSAAELTRVRPYLTVADRRAGSPTGTVGPMPRVGSASPGSSRWRDTVTWSLRARAGVREIWEESWGERTVWKGLKTYTRLRVSYGERLALSLALEKDAGERLVHDHVVGSLVWRSGGTPEAGPVVALGLGEFSVGWAQGLALRSGGFPSVAAYPRMRDGLRPYDGAGEAASRRGAWVVASRGLLTVSGIAAGTDLDAATDDRGRVTSVRSTGYHRTAGEREGAGVLRESLYGARVTADLGSCEVAGSALLFTFDPAIAPGDPVRKRYAFEGDELRLLGLDARFETRRLRAGCEFVSSSAGGIAASVSAAVVRDAWRVRAGAGYLAPDYWSPLGGGLPGVSSGSNGTAAWLRAEYRADAGWAVWSSARAAGRPWRTYNSVLPGESATLSGGAELRGGGKWRVSFESSAGVRGESSGDPPATVERVVRRDRIVLRRSGSSPVAFAVKRASEYEGDADVGSVLALTARVDGAVGDSGDYTLGVAAASRRGTPPTLVHYEPGLPGEFGLRSLNAAGARWYARVRITLPPGLGLSIRAAGGPGRDRAEFGVGLDARG